MHRNRRYTICTAATMLAGTTLPNAWAEPAETAEAIGLPPDLMNNVLVRIKLDDSSVCGFIANMGGSTYALTNTNLIAGHHRFTVATLGGVELRPTKIELSTTRDIARIRVDSGSGLDIATHVADGDSVVLVDFAKPGTTFSARGGTVENTNDERFDTTAKFGKEHCGSPVVNAGTQVCGIASNIDYYKAKGNSWEGTERHFNYRIDGSQWFAPNWKQYDTQFGRPLRDADEFRRIIYGLAAGWMENLKSKIETKEDVGLEVHRWIKQHNSMVTNLGNKRKSAKGGGDPLAPIRKDFSDSCNALAGICSSKAKTLAFVSEQKNASPFTRNQFKMRSRELMQFVKFVHAFEKEKEYYRW